MKYFSYGFLFGLAAGVVASFLKDPETQTSLRKETRDYIDGTVEDGIELNNSVQQLHKQAKELQELMPQMQATINSIQDNVANFGNFQARRSARMEEATTNLENNLKDLNDKLQKQ